MYDKQYQLTSIYDALKEKMVEIKSYGRKPNDEERAWANKMLDCEQRINNGEEIDMDAPQTAPVKPDPNPYGYRPQSATRTTTINDKLSYRGMFYPDHDSNQPLDKGSFRDMAEFIRIFDSGRYDPRLDPLYDKRASMAEVPANYGGLVVPEQFASYWLDESLPNEIVRNHARVFPMTSNTLLVPGWDGSDRSDGSLYGGLTMEFHAEGVAANKQTAQVRNIKLEAKSAMIYVDASLELVADGPGFADQLNTAMVNSIGYGLDSNCLRGNGAGRPLGALNANCKIQIAKETGQSADTIVYGNLKKMFARQLNPQNAVWIFNNNSIPELMEITVAVGTGGGFVQLLNEQSGTFTIFGRPVFFHPAMPPLGDADDCLFVDWGMYALGIRQDVLLDVTDAHRWTQRERSYRVLIRLDGQPTLQKAITPDNGDTLSPIVTLAERA